MFIISSDDCCYNIYIYILGSRLVREKPRQATNNKV